MAIVAIVVVTGTVIAVVTGTAIVGANLPRQVVLTTGLAGIGGRRPGKVPHLLVLMVLVNVAAEVVLVPTVMALVLTVVALATAVVTATALCAVTMDHRLPNARG